MAIALSLTILALLIESGCKRIQDLQPLAELEIRKVISDGASPVASASYIKQACGMPQACCIPETRGEGRGGACHVVPASNMLQVVFMLRKWHNLRAGQKLVLEHGGDVDLISSQLTTDIAASNAHVAELEQIKQPASNVILRSGDGWGNNVFVGL